MIVQVGEVAIDLTDDQVADLRRQLAIPDPEIDAEVAQREQAADDEALIDAREVARRLGCSVDYVRDHAAELGVIRLGDGPKPRLRFDPATIAARLTGSQPSPPAVEQSPRPRRRRRSAGHPRGELLKIRGERP